MEEILRLGIIMTVTTSAQAGFQIVIGEELTSLMACKLWALVRMNNDSATFLELRALQSSERSRLMGWGRLFTLSHSSLH